MEKAYQHQIIEPIWQQKWQDYNIGQPRGTAQPYCIMIPPPNVTGTLHMGHGFQLTLMDCLIRYHRMQGRQTLWQVGTDHAGIATQMVVEGQCAKNNISRHDLGREAFVEKIWAWKKTSGNKITQQMRRMGASVDWSRERFTLDEPYSRAVQTIFVKLYREGLIYRGKKLVNWDPKLTTAVSDLEVVNEERQGHLWYIRYPISNHPDQFIVVATTRPETMLGDQAVAVHPEDERYQSLIGKTADLPLTNRQIPIIADDSVDPEFGTGCVKITPAHDFNDYNLGQRHQLAMLNVLTADAHMNDNVPECYQGLERFAARKKIIADLQTLQLIDKIENHMHTVPIGDRSGVILEPFLTNQWFVKGHPLADPALKTVAEHHVEFIPSNWVNTYNHWLNNIQDWCISRQLWWGHRIPAWYDDANGQIYVGVSEDDVRQNHQLSANIVLRQDEDVLDTWFSSALWPFATLGWPDETDELKTFFPTSVLITGFDIIFFWVARMIMMSLKCTQKIPFEKVYITGLIRDQQGKKMSKSKGNVIDPIDLIDGIDLEALIEKRTSTMMQPKMAEKIAKQTRKDFPQGINGYGTDAVRFTFCALASTGRDIRFDMSRLEGYRNFCNKLWNASRFVLGQISDLDHYESPQARELTGQDAWIMHQLQLTIEKTQDHITCYRFDLLAKTLYEFVWHDFCDWYLELCKPILLHDASKKTSTQTTLLHVLDQILRLLHPITPFITDAIWENIAPLVHDKAPSLALASAPQVNRAYLNENAVSDMVWLKQFITQIRTLRADLNIPPNRPITVLLADVGPVDQKQLETHRTTLNMMLKIADLKIISDDDAHNGCAMAMVGKMKCLLPLAGLVDEKAELARLKKAIIKLTKKTKQAEARLANPHYCQNSPAEAIASLRQDFADWAHAIEKYQDLIEQLEQLEAGSAHDS